MIDKERFERLNEIRKHNDEDFNLTKESVDFLLDEIDRLRGEKQTPQGKTVDVRVAVAVSSNGEWTAAGWHDGDRDVVIETAMDAAFFPANVYWLTATLPVPAEVEVVATVEGE